MSPDGGPINMGSPLNVQAAPKVNMGPPPGTTPGSEKSVSFLKSILGPRPKHIIVNNVRVPVASDNEVKQFYKPLKVKESLNVTFDETPPPSKTSPLVDDDLDEEEAIKVTEKKNLESDIVDETLEIDEILNIKESRNHPFENVIGNLNQRTLRSQAQNQSEIAHRKFVIQNQFFSYSLEEFAQILDIPCEGACVFTDKWSLDELAYGVPTDGPYQTNPPSPDDIISSIRIDREGQVMRRIRHEEEIDVLEYQVLTREIDPTW
ncbi:hypothetical protein Tco_0421079 [Tanacetum coccineum]